MSCNEQDSNNNIVSNMHNQTQCIISKELVDAAFAYQREIIELQYKKSKISNFPKELEPLMAKIEILKEERVKHMQVIQELDIKLKEAKRSNISDKVKIQELQELSFSMCRQDVPPDVKLRCREEIRAVHGVPNPYLNFPTEN